MAVLHDEIERIRQRVIEAQEEVRPFFTCTTHLTLITRLESKVEGEVGNAAMKDLVVSLFFDVSIVLLDLCALGNRGGLVDFHG